MSDFDVAIASDHAGFSLKETLKAWLVARGLRVKDFGVPDERSVDYPDFAHPLCRWVEEASGRGVLICGSGVGMSIAANRHAAIRAALCLTPGMAELARKHNDANVLCLGARLVDESTAIRILTQFLDTAFEGGRHVARIEKLNKGVC